jgi:hypothetical protein
MKQASVKNEVSENSIQALSIEPVIYKESKVITTELLAHLYCTNAVRIRQNFSSNSTRFEEGKHFYRIFGNELKAFKNRVGQSYSVGKNAKSVILWTERGAARHAKMLETNAAWDVFESLEDHYFRKPAEQQQFDDAILSTVKDRYPLLLAAVNMVVKHRLGFDVVYRSMNNFAGAARFKEMTKKQVEEVAHFTERFLTGNDTRQDWLRIEKNRKEMCQESRQHELIGLSLTRHTEIAG